MQDQQVAISGGVPEKFNQKRITKKQLVVVALAMGILGAVLIFRSFAATPTNANLWVDPDGGSCSRQATLSAHNTQTACSSIQSALTAAQTGDTIMIKAGAYGAQNINVSKTSAGTIVDAEPGTTIGDLTTNGANYELRNLSSTGWSLNAPGTHDITLRDVNFSGNEGIYLNAAGYSNISWIGGSLKNFSCSNCAQGMAVYAGDVAGGTSVASNFLIDGVTFENIKNTGGDGNHFEVIRIDGNVNGFTVKNSTFTNTNASTSTLFFTTFRGTKPQNITLENNFFADAGSAYFVINQNFQGLATCSNWIIRYNTFLEAPIAQPDSTNGCSFSNVVLTGNLAPAGSCQGTAWFNNVWYGSGPSCGTSDKVIPSADVRFASDGFHLLGDSKAINAAGTGANCITRDHDGNARPQGSACDAGAHEYGAAPPVSNVNTRYVATNGNDLNACSQTNPCSSIARAYQQTPAGGIVEVAAGQYGRQVVAGDTKAVTIRGASGVIPILGTVQIESTNVTLVGFAVERNDDPGPNTATLQVNGANNTFDRVNVNSKNMPLRQGIAANGDNNTYKNGSTFNVTDEKAVLVDGKNNTFDHFDFYNAIYSGQNGDVHMECAYVIGADGFVLKNSRFWNCATMDLMFTRGSWYGAPAWGNVVVENNFFGKSTNESNWHYYGLLFNGAMTYDGASLNNFKVRYNTFEQPVAMDNFNFTGASEWVGNLGSGWDCLPGMTYSYNVGTKCSATDKLASEPYGFVKPSNPANHFEVPDLRLKDESVSAINAGDPTSFPATDIDCGPRPGGAGPDAGADEYGVSGDCAGGYVPPPPVPPPADNQVPIVGFASPPAGTTVSGVVTLMANATDDIGVTKVEFYRNGIKIGDGLKDSGSTYSYDWDSASVVNGTYDMTAKAYDASNKTATSAPAVAVTVANTPPPPNTQAPVAAYSFNEGTGTKAADSSGNANDLTIPSDAWTVSGKNNKAASFNGTAASVAKANDTASLDLGASGTIEAWFKPAALNQWHGLVAKGGANDDNVHNYALEVDNANKARCIIGNGLNAVTLVSNTTLSSTASFYHLACVWNGTTVTLYINGAADNSTGQSLVPSANLSPLLVGQYGGGSDPAKGIIDDVRIYNKALTAADITSDMAAPVGDGAPTESIPPTIGALTLPGGTSSADVSGIVTVTAQNVSGGSSSVNRVEFAIDGTVRLSDVLPNPYDYSFDTRSLANGPHTINATVYDNESPANKASAQLDITVNNPDTTPPTSPASLSASVTQPTTSIKAKVELSWPAGSDNAGGSGLKGYYIYRDGVVINPTDPSGNTQIITGLTFTDTGTPANSGVSVGQHTYAVRSVDNAGLVSTGTVPEANVIINTPKDDQAPSAPTGLAAAAVSTAQINVTWKPSADNVATQGYRVYRNGIEAADIAASNCNSESCNWGEANLNANTTYSYYAKAYDGAGNLSAQSNIATATTHALPAASRILLGSEVIQSGVDINSDGKAEAFKATASATGTASLFTIYLDQTSVAKNLKVGIYSNRNGHPHKLLSKATISYPKAGNFNYIALPKTTINAGGVYWISFLNPEGSGDVVFRDKQNNTKALSETSFESTLQDLPTVWKTGTVYKDGPATAYISS